jgi:hypothetical protein
MPPKTKENLFRLALLPLTAILLIATGCTSSLTNATQSTATGPTFVVGTDAPLASVVSFQLQLTDIELTNSTTSAKSGNLLAQTATVDFARYNGLQGLVDMTGVQPGTYDGVTITMGTAQIGYLNVSTCTPTPCSPAAPTIVTEGATLSSPTVSISLPHTLTVNATGGVPVGLRLDLDLSKTIPVTNGSFGTAVTPTFDVSTVARTDTGAHIDWFAGGVVTPPTGTTATNSFVIQGPHGENFTIDTTSSTGWDGDASLSKLETDGASAVVAVAGQFDPAAQTFDADEIAILTDTHFYADGLVTYVSPSSGPATAMDFYVRGVLPSELTEVPLGQIAQVSITGNENYGIYWMHNAFTDLLFNASALTPGQEITVGGADPTASPFDVNRIHLQNWGYRGTIVAGSQSPGANVFGTDGSFTMTVNGFAGQVIPSNVVVYLGPQCDFRYGLGAFGGLSDGTTVRVVGLLLKNSSTGQLVLLARHVDGLTFTDMTTAAAQQ